jgi:hypothetical protein
MVVVTDREWEKNERGMQSEQEEFDKEAVKFGKRIKRRFQRIDATTCDQE